MKQQFSKLLTRKKQDDIDIPDLNGRLALVTGANSGIGFGTARRLATAGAEVILAVRSHEKGSQAARDIEIRHPGVKLRVELIDLGSLQSIARCVDRLRGLGQPVDILVNNAGVMAPPTRHTTVDGYELQLGVNFLGHFALTAGLLPLLRQAGAARVTTLSSGVNRFARIRFEDLQWERKYSPSKSYAQSKLANLMFALELDRRSRAGSWNLVSNAAHPGATVTNLQSTGPNLGRGTSGAGIWMRLSVAIPGAWQDIDMGSLPVLYAATNPYAIPGAYYGPDGWGELTGMPKIAHIPRQARDEEAARRLWQVAEELTGARFLVE